MITDLESMTVEEFERNERHNSVAETRYWCAQWRNLAKELARRLEEAQQKIVAQQAVVSNALEAISATHFFDDPKSRMQRARAVLQSDDLSALAAHDAELTAKAKAEALEELQVLCSKFNIPLPKIVGNQAAGYRAKAGRKE